MVSGGYHETGSLAFTLKLGTTTVYTTSDTLTGNGTYTASYTLPTTGTVAGTYTWSVSYVGDGNNNSAADQGGTAEQTVITPACPTISTTPGGTVVIGAGTYMTDSATLSGGYNPTGSIMFYLFAPGATASPHSSAVYDYVATVSGNGTYTTSPGFLPTGIGTYEWVVAYSGDSNNGVANSGFGSESEAATTCTPHITVTKTADSAEIVAGQTAGYTVTITNTSSVAATGVTLSDLLPAGKGKDLTWSIDTSGKGLGAGTTPNDFTIGTSGGSQNSEPVQRFSWPAAPWLRTRASRAYISPPPTE